MKAPIVSGFIAFTGCRFPLKNEGTIRAQDTVGRLRLRDNARYPQFYFDTEILLSNTGDDCHGNIHSNFPGGWSEHGDDVSGFAAGGHTEEARAFQVELHAMLNGRSTAVAAHTGSLKPYATVAGSYVYFHCSADQSIMVIFNQGDASETLEMARFDELLRGRRRLVNALTNEALNPGEALEVLGWKARVLEAQG